MSATITIMSTYGLGIMEESVASREVACKFTAEHGALD
jgi:hypothetical protein